MVVVDIAQKEQLETLFGASSVVLNCTGPFRFLGDGVVLACIAAGAHYLDICGEPQFMESSFLNYHEAAKSKGVLILHACAFDSVPADLGAVFVSRQVRPPRYMRSYSLRVFASHLL